MSASAPYTAKFFFIRRPVLSAVLSIVITLLGVISALTLPIARFPSITPPSVQVTANYPGATAEDVAQSVAAPIEQQLSNLDGLLYFKSANSSAGVMNLQVYFDVSRSQDLAAVDVQNAIKLAESQLPEEVRRQGITIKKANTDILFLVALTSEDPRYTAAYLSNYAKLYIEDELKRVRGVGDALVYGELEFSMLLSLDPDRLAQLGLTVQDVAQAVREQNATNPAGRLGRQPSPSSTQLTLPVTTSGRLRTPDEFGNIIVRARPDGSVIRVKDVGTVSLGSKSYEGSGRLNGKPAALIQVYTRAGANALDVKKAVLGRMGELSRTFPAGVKYQTPFDTTPFITESIKEVVKTLVEAMLLVTLVVFLFLQSWRATLIPLLAVPVSIVGTFLGMQALVFSINTLTLFGLVLAIGIVVDNAIVVIENVERIMATEHVSATEAADRTMSQVAGALVAITLVLCAVFIPVAFLGGITGAMYKQFAVTIVISTVLSAVVALTLTPALCALLLKHAAEETDNRFFRAFNDWFGRLTARYTRYTGHVVDQPRTWMAVFAVMLVLLAVLGRRVPSGFLPGEDKGYFAVTMQLPDAASLNRTGAVVERVEGILRAQPEIRNIVAMNGRDILTGSAQTNTALVFVNLQPWDERSAKEHGVDAVIARVNAQLAGIKEANAFSFNLAEIPGLGSTSGLEMNLQSRGGGDYRQLAEQVRAIVKEANESAELKGANASIRTDVPLVYLNVDADAAQARGVGLPQLFSTLQSMLSTLYVNDFNLYGRTYRVQAEAQAQFRQSPEDIGRFYVRSARGEMVPLSALVRPEMRSAPSLITRFNGFPSALTTAQPGAGRSSGQMIAAAERIADRYADAGVGYAYSGQSFQEKQSAGTGALVFVFALVLVFLILAAQYESWSVPFAVLLSIPFGILGAFLGIYVRGMPNDVYFQIGLLAVVGLAAKNAILIVEFASDLVRHGRSTREAALEAARDRFRPILMTSFAFIAGVLPLMIASGAGAASRRSLGTGVFAGMLAATTVGIFFIPLFYAVVRSAATRNWRRRPAVVVPPVETPAPRPRIALEA